MLITTATVVAIILVLLGVRHFKAQARRANSNTLVGKIDHIKPFKADHISRKIDTL